jgi:hypothetical protein
MTNPRHRVTVWLDHHQAHFFRIDADSFSTSTAKLQFVRYLHAHAPAVEARIVGVETSDHPTDAQFAAVARRYFCVPDRMTRDAR